VNIARLAVIALLTLLLVLASPAPAQEMARSAGPLFQPVLRRQVEHYAAILNMDAEQKSSALMLYKGYREAFRQIETAGDKKLHADAEKKADPDGNQPRTAEFDAVNDFLAETKKLEASFFDDLKATLRPDQAEKFIRVERARHRDTGMRFSLAAGEGIDLAAIAETLKIERKGAIGEALDEYEAQTDRHMLSKADLFTGLYNTFGKSMMESKQRDMEEIQKVIKTVADHSIKVRDSNRRHARAIGSLLSDEQRPLWDREVRERSYPRVYAGSHVSKVFTHAEKVADLTDDQRTSLASLKDSYTRDADPINTRWAAAIDEKQSKFAEKGIAMIMELAGLDEKDSLVQNHKARRELDKQTLERITAILTEGQRDTLPPNPRAGEGGDEAIMRDIMPIEDFEIDGYKEFNDEDKE